MLHAEQVRRLDKLVLDVRRKNSRGGGYECPVSQYRTKKSKGRNEVLLRLGAVKEAQLSIAVEKS
jgi:hypothetical protein